MTSGKEFMRKKTPEALRCSETGAVTELHAAKNIFLADCFAAGYAAVTRRPRLQTAPNIAVRFTVLRVLV